MDSPTDFYQFYEVIGEGTFSTVYRARHIRTGEYVAIKVIPKDKLKTDNELALLRTEFAISRKIDHPHIAHFFDAFEDPRYVYLVIENAEKGEILEKLNTTGKYGEHRARIFMGQLLSAVDYLHNQIHVVHRDLKLENIVLDKYGNVRIVDFGLSAFFNTESPFLTEVVGSPCYAAPEIVQRQPYSIAVDIWCLGVLLFAVTAGYLPFYDKDVHALARKICYTDPVYPRHMPPCLKDLLSHMLAKDPLKRYTVNQIAEHPWMHFTMPDITSLFVYTNFGLDKEIVQKMHELEFTTDCLEADLKRSGVNRTTATYKILRTKKIIDQITSAERLKSLPRSKSGPLPTLRTLDDDFALDDEEAQAMSVDQKESVFQIPLIHSTDLCSSGKTKIQEFVHLRRRSQISKLIRPGSLGKGVGWLFDESSI